MQITLNIPEEVVTQLGALEQALPQALQIVLQELVARPQEGFNGFAEVLEFLANLPTPAEILALRPSPALQTQIDQLSTKYQNQSLAPEEAQLWKQYEYLEQVIRIAKAKAYLKLQTPTAA
ncbi:MAG: hypothetical protein RLZZ511_2580 [Cyanobacteriota bacterium]|jgi:hypothetical protein